MNNEDCLTALMQWWEAVPVHRRPGQGGSFRMIPSECDQFVLELRQLWSICGVGVLELCEPYRERLVRGAAVALDDLVRWLDETRNALERAREIGEPVRAEVSGWIVKWSERVLKTASEPMLEPFGVTLGVGPQSGVLDCYRWWEVEENRGSGGPMSDFPARILEATKSEAEKNSVLAKFGKAVLRSFPDSVNELQLEQAKSPWTAVYVLNWLLSDKGVLRVSHRAPPFAGPSAAPHARPWLDQFNVVFRDWRVAKFADAPGRPSTVLSSGKLIDSMQIALTPESEDAFHQLGSPVIPSAYVVEFGEEPIDMKLLWPAATNTLSAREGQCCVFDFLLSRISLLRAPSIEAGDDALPVPRFAVVDPSSRGKSLRLRIGVSTPVDISKGAAELLYVLGMRGVAARVPSRDVNDLRAVLREYRDCFSVEGKKGNSYAKCFSKALRGKVSWPAKKYRPPELISITPLKF